MDGFARMTKSIRVLGKLGIVACSAFALQVIPSADQSALAEQQEPTEKQKKSTLEFLHQGAKPNFLPIEDDRGVITFEIRLNSKVTWAILDTGSGNTIMDVGLAKRIGLTVRDQETSIKTTFGQTRKSKTSEATLTVPGQFTVSGEFNAAKLDQVSMVMGKEIGLILGLDILRHLGYLVDSKNGRLIFAAGGAINVNRPGASIVAMNEGVISGSIDGKPASFEIDLGSNSAVLLLAKS